MVPSTTYRDSWGLALALKAKTAGGVCPSESALGSPSLPAGEVVVSLQGKAAPPHPPALQGPLHSTASSLTVHTSCLGEVAASPSTWGKRPKQRAER
jgi:hypothetical protein